MPTIVEITVKFNSSDPVFKDLMIENNGGRPGDLIKNKLKQMRMASKNQKRHSILRS